MTIREKVDNIFRISWEKGYSQAFSDLFYELELDNYEDSDLLKVKYLRHAVERLLNEEAIN